MAEKTEIPFLSFTEMHSPLEKDLVEVFVQTLTSARFIGGPMVEDFERNFASLCKVKHAIGVASGTDALRFAYTACGIKSGDIVLTVPNTFIATSESISQVGALPEFIDIDETTYNISIQKLREYLESNCTILDNGETFHRTLKKTVRGIVPVHLYGQMADMDSILDIAKTYNLVVIEDACQAHGAQYFSKKKNQWFEAGSMGNAAAFSFYPGKNLGAFGEGGAVTTQDDEVARTVKLLRDHGQSKKYFHEIEGFNGRLDSVQAGVLDVKLKKLQQWNSLRRQNASTYTKMLNDISTIVCPSEPQWSKSVYHLYVIQLDERDKVQQFLTTNGIGTGLHYPIPLHLQKAYSNRGYKKGAFPISEKAATRILSLPMYPHLKEQQQQVVVNTLRKYYLL